MEAAADEEQEGISAQSPAQAPPSSASSLPKEQSQVELELRVLQALEFYPPSKLKGIHRHFVIYGLMEYLRKSLDRQFSADEVLQLLDRFFNLEMLKCLVTTTTTRLRLRPPAAPAAAAATAAATPRRPATTTPSPPPPAPTPPQPQTQPPPPPPPPTSAAHHAYHYQYQYQYEQPKPHQYPQPQQANPSDHSHAVLHSLLRRVAALESTLPRCFASPPVPPPLHRNPRHRPRAAAHREEEDDEEEEEDDEDAPASLPPPPRRARAPPSPARERAARTIQAHFRRFLARRSRTLRHLKELAVLRSKAAALRGSLSGRGRVGDPAAISEAAMVLLFHLDSIQGGDPMIREGKRAVSRELTRILEFVDKVLVKEHREMAMNGELDCKDYHEGCNAAFAANPSAMNKKKVGFCGNGKVQELHDEAEQEHGSDADESSETSSSAEAEARKRSNSKRGAHAKPGLAAPMPVYMEPRRIDEERR
uniref:BAG domain-containing protein n=1 Tax=Oryza nivara TaxID=4536 RepID=A0A0E0HGU8_ORYNI